MGGPQYIETDMQDKSHLIQRDDHFLIKGSVTRQLERLIADIDVKVMCLDLLLRRCDISGRCHNPVEKSSLVRTFIVGYLPVVYRIECIGEMIDANNCGMYNERKGLCYPRVDRLLSQGG
jgi:hypothetical protein